MLQRTHRLHAQTRLHHPYTRKTTFGFIKCAVNNLGHIRLGIIIPKKVAKTAVDRNRIRRMIHTVFTSMEEAQHFSKDYLVIVQKNIADDPMESLVAELEILRKT